MGSRVFVVALTEKPQAAIIVDMVGDTDLNLYIERNSDPVLVAEIWAQAATLGYGKYFIATQKYDMIDDHTPFLEAGIPAVDIIDFDYPYWHTTADTADKVSAHSLQAVGETLWDWIQSQKPNH
jgi:Zn-dependent M28 family amino/carboxypeptidase